MGLVALAVVGLTGCAPDSTSMVRDFLASDREADDALPEWAETDGSDPDSSRQVGTLDDVVYYVAEFANPETGAPGVCVILVSGADDFANSACGDQPALWSTGSETGSARLVEKDDELPDGWTRLSDFLIVNRDITS